jgi:hypothetical protein
MAGTIAHIVTCPICQSNGEMIHRDVRASLVYSCRNCSHEWQINPTDEPVEVEGDRAGEGDPAVPEPARLPSAGTLRPRKR